MHTTISVQPQSANVEKTHFYNLAYTVCRPQIEEGGQALRFEVEQS